ncbi:hypothetical protein EZV62_028157 [Acer yangbiense]|uniref:PI3K/PI4K catalytic domain-containing protein n=1 Tax=Acer yangbiense TaxID=1000413 RepID=A0A5C7GNH5_9ROSI|nr:hypothetical protein EZV62_028157 [Acer yangbiense]
MVTTLLLFVEFFVAVHVIETAYTQDAFVRRCLCDHYEDGMITCKIKAIYLVNGLTVWSTCILLKFTFREGNCAADYLANIGFGLHSYIWWNSFNRIKFKLSTCGLQNISYSLPFINFTSLSILDLSYNHFNLSAVDVLYELAKCLNTDMGLLIVKSLPKVLAFALHQSDERDLHSALNFYSAHTGSDNREIFAAVLPVLLDELVCFLDGGNSDEISKGHGKLGKSTQIHLTITLWARELLLVIRRLTANRAILEAQAFGAPNVHMEKIVLLGNDGIECPFLCKPKDDLRKDARMMEFTAMINRLLSKNPENRRRKLYIRTFAVISLTEDCVLENELVFRLLAASFCHFDQLLCTDHSNLFSRKSLIKLICYSMYNEFGDRNAETHLVSRDVDDVLQLSALTTTPVVLGNEIVCAAFVRLIEVRPSFLEFKKMLPHSLSCEKLLELGSFWVLLSTVDDSHGLRVGPPPPTHVLPPPSHVLPLQRHVPLPQQVVSLPNVQAPNTYPPGLGCLGTPFPASRAFAPSSYAQPQIPVNTGTQYLPMSQVHVPSIPAGDNLVHLLAKQVSLLHLRSILM